MNEEIRESDRELLEASRAIVRAAAEIGRNMT